MFYNVLFDENQLFDIFLKEKLKLTKITNQCIRKIDLKLSFYGSLIFRNKLILHRPFYREASTIKLFTTIYLATDLKICCSHAQ